MESVDKLSVLFWNVHNLKDERHASLVVDHIQSSNPDLFCLAEVIGPRAYELIAKRFPEHNFYMSYGRQSQELLVGIRRSIPAFFTQKSEFQSGNAFLRPAVLLTLPLGEPPLNVLFVHLKSFAQPIDLGYRDDFFNRVFALKRTLDSLSDGKAKFIVCGDMNFQGMHYLEKGLIKPEDEFRHVQNEAGDNGMLFLEKSKVATWKSDNRRGGTEDLDHVVASSNIEFVEVGDGRQVPYQVKVSGWNQFVAGSQEEKAFIETVSDHCSIGFEIKLK